MRSARQFLKVCTTLLWLLVPGMLVGGARAQISPKPKSAGPPVLVLVSRSPSDVWAVAELDGILRGFRTAKNPFTPVVEYLDWQGNSGPEYEQRLVAYYAVKFASRKFKVVIAADEPAVNFVRRQRQTLFPEVEAVFCGIQDVGGLPATRWFTALLESNDAPGTFRLARRLQPGLKRFVILEDASLSGEAQKRCIEEAFPGIGDRVQLELLRTSTTQDLFAAVEALPADSAVLMTRARLARRVMEELRERCPVPIYGMRAPMHLPGILGGSVLDGEVHGEAAARTALELLAGKKAADIPFQSAGWHRLVVDYGQVQRFGFPLSALPPECEVLNRPPTLWERHGRVLLAGSGVIAVLGVLVAGLLWQLRLKRAAMRQLDHSLSMLHATLESIADGVLVVDLNGRVTGSNECFHAMWSIPADVAASGGSEEILRFALTQARDPATLQQRTRELYANPDRSGTDVIELKDGRTFERESRPQRQGERIVGRVCIFRDVTARRLAEQEREHLAAQLAQAQKMEALGTLAGGIAHDFNNMLTGILGCSHLALDRLPPTHPAADELRHVIESAERAGDLVRQILTFSRKRAPERKVVSLEPVVRDTLRLLRATAPAAIELAAELHPGVPPVLGDPAQLHQALLNLCTNAIHAMGRGPGELRVLLTRAEPPPDLRASHPELPAGPLVSLSVSDTGHGMDAATLARVFEPFYSTKATGEGTGLGLAVVHGIVQAHEGAITAQSEPGLGTAFTMFFLPSDAPAPAPAAEPDGGVPVPHGRGESILVVDDEPVVGEVAAAMLRHLGYQPHICHSGERALELLQSEPGSWALVFTDLNMPRITGLDLIRRLREAGCTVPCVLTTGYIGSRATESEARALGVCRIVEKPFTEQTLGLAVSAALDAAPRVATPA